MKNVLQTLPDKPGVYLFKNREGAIIYIGKAKSLKKRVSHYFNKQRSDWKIESLLAEATTVDYIVTLHENEALVLEAQLIKEHQPKFNVLLKSGQPFLFLRFSPEGLALERNKKKKGKYFGPFIHKQHARRVYDFLIRIFTLYCCNKKIENGCLDFHLGRCAGSCKKQFDAQSFAFRLLLAQDALQQDRKWFLKKIEEKIKEHSTSLEFEKAKNLLTYQENFESIFKALDTKFSLQKYASDISIATTPILSDDTYEETAQELKDFLKLDTLPERIDCFDVSHFQSSYIVGSCIRFYRGKPDKTSFRRFKIQSLVEQNDYAALQECVIRRYKEHTDLPDIVLIDGGKGQRNAILPLVKNIPCVSLAKKEELLFSEHHTEGTPLHVNSKIGKLLICLRDYAHHFAISYHRLLRNRHSYEKGKKSSNN